MKVTIEHFGREIEVDDLQTILEAALDAGIDYPFACQQGQCGACKSLLLAGAVDMGALYNPLVCTPAERARGLVLACQSLPLADCVIAPLEVDGALLFPQRELDCIVTTVTRPADDTLVVRMRIDAGAPFHFAAGQYARVQFAGMPALDLALASSPDDAALEFHVVTISGDQASTAIVSSMQSGSRAKVWGPSGAAHLREEQLGPMLVVAAGSGLAAAKSILTTVAARGMAQPVHVFCVARGAQDAWLEAELLGLAGMNSNFSITFRKADELDATIAQNIQDPASLHAYVFGPPRFRAAVRRELLMAGFASDTLYVDTD